MATYFVWDGGNNTTGADWTNAFTALAGAIAAATGTDDTIKIAHTHTGDNALAADTTWSSLATNLKIISVDKTASDAPTPMGASAWIGSTTNRAILINGESTLYCYGLTLRVGGSTADNITFGGGDAHSEAESCYFWQGNTSTTARIQLGSGASGQASFTRYVNCDFQFGNASQCFVPVAAVEMYGCRTLGSAITKLFLFPSTAVTGSGIYAEGCDFSSAATSANLYDTTSGLSLAMSLVIANSKLPTSFVMFSGGTSKCNGEISVYNCASGDTHWFIGHADAMGSTQAISTIYPTTNTTGNISWQVTTTANATFGAPYYTPWFDVYHAGTSAITPEIEILRDGSATAFTTAEVWGDFSFQRNSGSPLSTIKSSRAAPLSAGSSLADGIGSGSWTNPPATNKSSKIVAPSATTPAEVGHLRARVCMGIPSTTLYADPTIRGI